MKYLIDTNTVTALAHGHSGALAHLSALASNSVIGSCFVVAGEWEYGVRNATGHDRQEAIRIAGEQVFGALDEMWQSTPEVSTHYGTIQAKLRSVGRSIPANDAWIAAVALANNAVVITADPHFLRVDELIVEDWTA